MGKGKGKLSGWSSEVPAGLFFVEFKNLRYGRAVYFGKQILHKTAANAKIVSKFPRNVHIAISPKITINYDVVW